MAAQPILILPGHWFFRQIGSAARPAAVESGYNGIGNATEETHASDVWVRRAGETAVGRINDKIERRVLAGKHGMIVWWKVKAGAHAGAHQHPHEQIVWMLKGKMDFRIGNERRSMIAGDVAVIPGDVEHEGFFSEDTEVVDIFAPPREDFLAGGTPSYMRAP
jgi:quercetin dioxygenase-like cupin family protein